LDAFHSLISHARVAATTARFPARAFSSDAVAQSQARLL
jgi:hypothetical protein